MMSKADRRRDTTARTRSARRVAPVHVGGPVPQSIHAHLRDAARRHRVDPALLYAVADAESRFRPASVSRAGAVGVMQLMPHTARRYGVRDRRDPRQNIDGGARYLRYLLARYNGDRHLALAAYNAGEGAVAQHGGRIPPYRETRRYVPKVLSRYQHYRQHLGSAGVY